MAKDKEDMWARMQAFATMARSLVPKCENEEQTKISLINPYLEILGYDVRDPDVCRFEFKAAIFKSNEKVDYAIMQDGKPAILIEAKAATTQFSEHASVPVQFTALLLVRGGCKIRCPHKRRRLELVFFPRRPKTRRGAVQDARRAPPGIGRHGLALERLGLCIGLPTRRQASGGGAYEVRLSGMDQGGSPFS